MNEQKNLLLAIVASLIILMIFQYLFPNKPEVKNVENNNNIIVGDPVTAIDKIVSREEIVTKDERIFISKESRLKGSLSLKGARFDDIILLLKARRE